MFDAVRPINAPKIGISSREGGIQPSFGASRQPYQAAEFRPGLRSAGMRYFRGADSGNAIRRCPPVPPSVLVIFRGRIEVDHLDAGDRLSGDDTDCPGQLMSYVLDAGCCVEDALGFRLKSRCI